MTTNAADSRAVEQRLGDQPGGGQLALTSGFYAGVAAIDAGTPLVVLDVGPPGGRDDWRLAELRSRAAGISIAVVADATHLPMLAGALSADLAVTSASRLPPLRELAIGDGPGDQNLSVRGRSDELPA